MSWSLSGKVVNPEGFADVEDTMQQLQAFDRSKAGNDQCLTERDEQIDRAQKITSVLLATEVFEHAEEITVNMSGHANADHKKSGEGWSNESIHIGVSVSKYKGEGE